MAYLLVALGGALGATGRWGVAQVLPAAPEGFPWATLTVNLVGCLSMGLLLAVLAARRPDSATLRAFVGTGVLGGFTTYSAFAVDAVLMVEDGAVTGAVGYVLASVLGGVLAVAAGLVAGRALLGARR